MLRGVTAYARRVAESSAARNASSISEFGFGRLFWLTHEAVVGADLETQRIVLWNPSAERIFGYTADEAIDMPLDRLVPAELTDAHRMGISRFRAGGEAHLIGGPPVEVPAVCKSGDTIVISLTLTAVDEDRRHVAALARDVTAQKALEADQQRAYDAMRSFVAAASHDLSTPLVTVMGFAGLLVERGPELTADQRDQFARSILRAGEHASHLVRDLLTVSKIQAGVVDARPQSVPLRDAAEEAVAALDLLVELEEVDGLPVWADSHHVQRILRNLLSNAEKYGEPPIRLRGRRVRGGVVEVRVCDAGSGIPAHLRAQLFDPFTRGGSTSVPGTGLGLSIVKGLVEANGGSVRYDCDDPAGSCFVLTFLEAADRDTAAE